MSWTTDPSDAPAGDVEPAVHDESTSAEPAPGLGDAPLDFPFEGESTDLVETRDAESADAVEDEDEVLEFLAPEVVEDEDAAPEDEAPEDAASEDDASEDAAPEVVEPPREPDERLLAAHDIALAALLEVTPEATIGAPAGYTLEEGGVVSLLFENRMPGYPGWFWTVSLARVDDEEPSVLELELLPGHDALLAPEWVPWAVRLADYQAAQVALREAGEVDAEDDDADESDDEGLDLDDLDDLDAADFDRDGSPILHAGDVDGVDIDELAEAEDVEVDADDEGFDDDSDDDDSDVDDSDFVDDDEDSDDAESDDEDDSDEDDSDEDDSDEDDSDEDDSDEDDSDEDDSDEDEVDEDDDDSNEDSDEDDSDDDDSVDEDDAAHGSRFDFEREN